MLEYMNEFYNYVQEKALSDALGGRRVMPIRGYLNLMSSAHTLESVAMGIRHKGPFRFYSVGQRIT